MEVASHFNKHQYLIEACTLMLYLFLLIYFSSLQNLHDVVQLKPWHLIQIPFELTPFDTGGTLEVSLQLEPLDITKEVNGEKMKVSFSCRSEDSNVILGAYAVKPNCVCKICHQESVVVSPSLSLICIL